MLVLDRIGNVVHLPDEDVRFSVVVNGGPLPEHMKVSYRAEEDGGNSRRHELVLTWGGGSFEIEPTFALNGCNTGLRLKMCGDWEHDGFVDAFIALGEHLKVYRNKS